MFDNPSSIHTLAPLVIGALWALMVLLIPLAISFARARRRLMRGSTVDQSTHTTQVLVLVNQPSPETHQTSKRKEVQLA